ncbi:TRAP transporter small permease subunit [Vibrio sp.]|uniref:TRAP transporter small permease protein n=1 Tax=Vibrio viridaestus TaxID=2487322 RepID=A0A3N9TEF3_9VIBR|nr:TRAP transporter small permease [Vibrio viridaestus]MDC0610834.1 TRAP transporter small permease subunit [Vibrio sp.]RQW62617.1 TRAP transporter small permease [Vibrio viridaestus]
MKLLMFLSAGINRIAGSLAILLIIYMLCHIILEIGLRMFGHSTFVLDEFVGYAVAAMTFLALGYSLERNALIQVNILRDKIGSAYQWLLDLFASLLTLCFFSWIAYYWSITVTRNFIRHTTSQSLAATPLWIPQGLVLVGLSILCLTLTVRILSLLIYRQPPVTGAYSGE